MMRVTMESVNGTHEELTVSKLVVEAGNLVVETNDSVKMYSLEMWDFTVEVM